MPTIKLNNADVWFTVSQEDEAFCGSKKWHLTKGGYPATHGKTKTGKDTAVLLHTLLLTIPEGHCADHINRNKLDNTRENLRIVTISQNTRNSTRQKRLYSRYKGVTWHTGAKKFYAFSNRPTGGFKSLGFYPTEIEAALAYNFWVKHHYGEFAYLNPVHI